MLIALARLMPMYAVVVIVVVVALLTAPALSRSDPELATNFLTGVTSSFLIWYGAILIDIVHRGNDRDRSADELWLALARTPASTPIADPQFASALEVFLVADGRMSYRRAHAAVEQYRRTGDPGLPAWGTLEALLTRRLYRHARRTAQRPTGGP